MYLSRRARLLLRLLAGTTMAFLYLPLAFVAVLSFNEAHSFSWPPPGYTLRWWDQALTAPGPRDALWTFVRTATSASLIAVVLGTLAAFALQRFKFFGRDSVNLLIILPIALPGIVTGMALSSAFVEAGLDKGFLTLVVAHSTFCIVLVYNNVIARLRRLSPSLDEASADLGADSLQTFRYVTFPMVRSALLAGALLAFGLSFDEIVVTTFTAGAGIETLPQWIFNNMFRPASLPVVNVVATLMVALTVIPVYLAQRVSDGAAGVTAGR